MLINLVTDFVNDIDIALVTPSFSGMTFPSDVKIMRGINRPWSAVHETIIAEVKSLIAKYPDYTLEAVGHSLGGALTYLAHVALAQNFPDKQITSNALAAFPIGNEAWANFAGSQPGTLNRGNNILDGVPVSHGWTWDAILKWLTIQHRTCTLADLSTSSTMEPWVILLSPFHTNVQSLTDHDNAQEYYSSGTEATTVKCDGQRDRSCSAGNGMYAVTVGHFSSFGVVMLTAGCGLLWVPKVATEESSTRHKSLILGIKWSQMITLSLAREIYLLVF